MNYFHIRNIRSVLIVLALCPSLALAEGLELTADQVANMELTTVTVESREVHPTLDLNGMLVADRYKVFRIAPVVEGIVTTLKVVEHDQVRQGQTLAQLRSNGLGQAQADYLEALAHFQLSQAEQTRTQTLWQDGVVQENRWLKADSDYKRAQAALDQAKRLLSLTGLPEDQIRALEQNPKQLAEFSLVSPVDGIVMNTWVETGQMLSGGESAFRVVDLSSLWVEVPVPTANLSQINLGGQAQVKVSAYPDQLFSGLLQSVGGEVDEDSQTLQGRLVIENKSGLLRPGMYAQITLTGKPQQGLMVPGSTVFHISDQPYVFKVVGPRRFEPVAIEIGTPLNTWVPVTKGALSSGTEIVNGGLAELKSHWLYQGGE